MKRIFFTGIPGSRWSGIAQIIESTGLFDISDRTPSRQYIQNNFTGHQGSYFGTDMEFPVSLNENTLNAPFDDRNSKAKYRLLKSHEWSTFLDRIKTKFPNESIVIVYRNVKDSYTWWKQAGGFDITYPNYSAYVNNNHMKETMLRDTEEYFKFAAKNNLVWEKFTKEWVETHFGAIDDFDESLYSDVYIAAWNL
jgi:hypothetical protein